MRRIGLSKGFTRTTTFKKVAAIVAVVLCVSLLVVLLAVAAEGTLLTPRGQSKTETTTTAAEEPATNVATGTNGATGTGNPTGTEQTSGTGNPAGTGQTTGTGVAPRTTDTTTTENDGVATGADGTAGTAAGADRATTADGATETDGGTTVGTDGTTATVEATTGANDAAAGTDATAEGDKADAAEDETTKATTLSMGSKGDAVLSVQNALKDLGYPGFIADGDFGENTQLAVKIFQFYNGIPVTGEADAKTQDVLFGDEAEKYADLINGSTGKAVQIVQEYLHEAGFLKEEPDGSFGPGTEDAVKLYQSAAGIENQNGSVGKETVTKMLGEQIAFETIKLGDSGAFVGGMQTKLKELGFLKDDTGSVLNAKEKKATSSTGLVSRTPSGTEETTGATGTNGGLKNEEVNAVTEMETETFGKATEMAVKEFQMYAGLEITGVADAETCGQILRKAVYYSNLGRSSKGSVITTMQTLLMDLGYQIDEADGSYGPQTKKAVRDFQVVNNLSRDGSFGKKTADTLFGNPLPYDQEVLDNAGNDAEAFAKEILDEIGWDLYAAFEWSVGIKYVQNLNGGYSTTDSAIYSFVNRAGNCLGLATTFYWFARALGYEARCIVGSVPYRDSDEFGEHAWVEVDVDGDTFVCDPDFEMQTKKNGYMIRYGQSGTWEYRYGYVLED